MLQHLKHWAFKRVIFYWWLLFIIIILTIVKKVRCKHVGITIRLLIKSKSSKICAVLLLNPKSLVVYCSVWQILPLCHQWWKEFNDSNHFQTERLWQNHLIIMCHILPILLYPLTLLHPVFPVPVSPSYHVSPSSPPTAPPSSTLKRLGVYKATFLNV